jgi:hypothetical protein
MKGFVMRNVLLSIAGPSTVREWLNELGTAVGGLLWLGGVLTLAWLAFEFVNG